MQAELSCCEGGSHVVAVPLKGQGTDVGAVDADGASGGVVESLQQLDDGALAAARRAHQSHRLAGHDVQVQVREDGDIRTCRIRKRDCLDVHVTLHPLW